MRSFVYILILCLASACASTPKVPQQKLSETPPSSKETPRQVSESNRVDLVGLNRSLGLERSKRELGYQEKSFNTCQAGFGYPSFNCSQQTLFSINVLVQCRDTTGTTSEVVTSAQLDPIANRNLKWEVANHRSTTTTDDEGYAQLIGVMTNSPRAKRLRLSVGDQFVYVRTGELTRIVTPANWCH